MSIYRGPQTTPPPSDSTLRGVFRNNSITVPTPPPPPPPPTPTPVAPVATVNPVISGNLVRGSTLTAVAATWTGTPTPTVTRTWLRDGVAISGANNLTYVTVAADEGAIISFLEYGTNTAGTVTAYSNNLGPITAVAGTLPSALTAPSISAVIPVIVGAVLTRVAGTYSNATSITGRWLRNGSAISGATGTTYLTVAADVDNYISYRETATNAFGSIVVDTSSVDVSSAEPSLTPSQTVDMSLHPAEVSILRQDGGISTYVDVLGTLVRPNQNTPRYHYNNSVFQGLYVEKAASNLCAYGRTIGDVGWTTVGTGVTVSPFYGNGPTGTQESTRLQIAASSGFAGLFYQTGNAAGILRNSMYIRSLTGVPQVIWMRHPANGLEVTPVPTTWTRLDKVGLNQDGSNFNIHIIQATGDPVDVEIWGVDLCPNGTTADSLIATQSTLGNRPSESMTITLNTATRNRSVDVVVTFDDGSKQSFTNQAVTLQWVVNATQLSRRLVKKVEFFAVGSIPPTSAPPPPPPPPASGSAQDFLYTGLRDMRKDPATGSYTYLQSYADNDAPTRLRSESYTSSQETRAQLTMGAWGTQKAWDPAFNLDYNIDASWVGGTERAVVAWPTLVGWDQLYQSSYNSGQHATGFQNNSRVRVWDKELWVRRISTGTWVRLATAGDTNGETWRPNFNEYGGSRWNGSISGTGVDIRGEGNGLSFRTDPPSGPDRFWVPHTYYGYVTVNPYDIDAICSFGKAALIKHNENGVDDRDFCHYLYALGADWYPPSGSGASYPGAGTSRAKRVIAKYPDWQYHIMHTMSWNDFLASHPTPSL